MQFRKKTLQSSYVDIISHIDIKNCFRKKNIQKLNAARKKEFFSFL